MTSRILHPLAICAWLPPLLLWPWPRVAGDALVTAPDGEGPVHLWGWWAALRLRAPVRVHTDLLDYPDGLTFALVDPLHLLPYAAGAWSSLALGFNLVLWFGLFLAGCAGWLLSREAGADRGGQVLGALAGLSCPGVLAVAVDGVTEGLGVGWVGIQLALLLGLRRDAAWWRVGALALALAACVYGGTYNAIFAAAVDVPVGLWLLRRTRRHLLAALGALLAGLPYLLAAATKATGPGATNRLEAVRPPEVAAWRGAWTGGADLLDLLVPAPFTGECAALPSTAYLGLVLVVLATVGLARHRRWPWLAGALAFAVLALGPWLVVAGDTVTTAPVALLERYTPLARLTRWYRAGAVAVLLLTPLAARAFTGRTAALAGILVLLDARLLAPLPASLPTLPLPEGSALVGLQGPIAELPPIHPKFQPGTTSDENLLLQVLHGQPTTGTLDNVPGRATVHPALRAVRRVLRGEGGTNPVEVATDAGRELRAMGYRYLAVYTRRVETWRAQDLDLAFGAPVARDDVVVVYRLD